MDEHEDVEIAPDEEAGEERAESKVAKMRGEIARLRKEKQEYMDGWQRAKADYVNALRRFEEERRVEGERGLVKAVEALLPAFDALERAREHLSSEALAKEGGEFTKGMAAVAKQLESAFKNLGLKSVGALGELFNPTLHEALGQDPTDVCEIDDTVSAVLERGYKLGDRLLRPAKVRVYHLS